MKVATVFSHRATGTMIEFALKAGMVEAEHFHSLHGLIPTLRASSVDAVLIEDDEAQLTGLLTMLDMQGLRGLPVIVFGSGGAKAIYRALHFGADDYATLAEGTEGLLQRLEARVDRCGRPCKPSNLRFGNVELDVALQGLSVGERKIQLTTREFALVRMLFENVGRVVSLDKIAAELWGRTREIGKRTIEQHIYKLRQKFDQLLDSASSLRIRAVYGIGYRLEFGAAI